LIIVSAINAALWERRPAAIISDMMCKYRGETPLPQQWMAETMIKAGFYMRWPCLFAPRILLSLAKSSIVTRSNAWTVLFFLYYYTGSSGNQAMDQIRNHIPPNVRKIHIVAVCGTGMGALACMLQEIGLEVTGSDQKVYPPMSTFLAAKGISVADGFRAENIPPDTDLVVIGNAVRRDNPEARAVRERELCYCSMPQALNHFAARDKKIVLVAGTHGKTTTSALMAWILHHAGADPSFMIGGILRNFDSNYRVGTGPHIVIEGDEYDTAFFDKGPKFMHYPPFVATLTSVEFDHADIFRDLDHVKDAFRNFVDTIPSRGTLVAHDEDPNIDDVIAGAGCRVERYGASPDAFWRFTDAQFNAAGTSFDLLKGDDSVGRFESPMLGAHNLSNTVAVIAMAHRLGLSFDAIAKALAEFKGVKRRQEIRGEKRGVTVLDDFAHHPTAVRETLAAVKPAARNGRLIAVFEPRTNSSMRDIFQEAYTRAFDDADMICIRRPPLLEKIPEGHRFSSEKLVADLTRRGKNAFFFPDTDAIVDFLVPETRTGDMVFIMSNGGFDNIHDKLLQRL
jgi:UDP-N-acetylmuramate: L-alanyl-gamma-D-glutamyl-meso-diaminopimelate ligase